MEILFVAKDARLRRREDTLQVVVDGAARRLPIERLRHVVLLGQADLNSATLGLCGTHGVRVSVFDWHGWCRGTFEPFDGSTSGVVRLAHARCLLDETKRQLVAREIVRAALFNLAGNLRYHLYRGNDALRATVDAIAALEREVTKASDRASLMGVEGNARLLYYEAWGRIDERLAFGRRVRRPPNNPINCLISFLNQLVYATVRHEIAKTHLEPTFGFLQPRARVGPR